MRDSQLLDSSRLLRGLLERCPAPAVLITPPGRLRLANAAARAELALPGDGLEAGEVPVRQVLGLGWRELSPIARDGASDLVLDLPAAPEGAPARRRSVRVRTEALWDGEGTLQGILAFIDPPSKLAAAQAPRRRGLGEIRFETLFGSDEALVAARSFAARFAATALPVLLLAETGTGKDLLARAIHQASPRRAAAFVAINCGGLSPHLLESELFGYGPGAFTGAKREGQEGKVGAAHGGTLFLDEVAEMPGALQAILLRFLEDGTYYRVGENKPRRADVRLICATCRDLPALVSAGAFRQDLYYRIKGACITLPPLRRRTDRLALAQHLLEQLCGAEGRTAVPRLAATAREWIEVHDWPGNVRELKTALHHALILAEEVIGLDHLPSAPVFHPRSLAGEDDDLPLATTPESKAGPEQVGRTLFEVEGEAVRQALELAAGNLSEAARSLGVARSTLYRLMDRHGLERAAEAG